MENYHRALRIVSVMAVAIWLVLAWATLAVALEFITSFTYEPEIEEESLPPLWYHDGIESYSEDHHFNYRDNILGVSSERHHAVERLVMDMAGGSVDTYGNFLERARTLDEAQQVELLGALGRNMGVRCYVDHDDDLCSREEAFRRLQQSMSTGSRQGIGVCRHIHASLERWATDLDLPAAAVTVTRAGGDEHVVSLVQTDHGLVVIDYDHLVLTDSWAPSDALDAYAKRQGVVTFSHDYFEDGEFRYHRLSGDGRRILEFFDYDETSGTLKEYLLHGGTARSRDYRANHKADDLAGYLRARGGGAVESLEGGCIAFGKAGQIRGDEHTPLQRGAAFDLGAKQTFAMEGAVIQGHFAIVGIELDEEGDPEESRLSGMILDLYGVISDGENWRIGYRYPGMVFLDSVPPFSSPEKYDRIGYQNMCLGIGGVYGFEYKRAVVEPYALVQTGIYPREDIGECYAMDRLFENPFKWFF